MIAWDDPKDGRRGICPNDFPKLLKPASESLIFLCIAFLNKVTGEENDIPRADLLAKSLKVAEQIRSHPWPQP